ncbi:MAG: hypothetical protein K9W46_11520 [Candidatus Heimdallarchaeum endolithica]|uniref:Uncharacterized protein n=1 Tax=Candidatus Heimdallarchaeum endolithica TaxID=2876572 RepID=A0A9Y1BQC1_9ARCH|nr:MAG: hypothetical protein K9W46_11520 [Candidatus Heimdallarchaeum endolithica]
MKKLQNFRNRFTNLIFEKIRNKAFSREKSILFLRASKLKSALCSNQIPIAPSSLKRYIALLLLSLMLFSSPLLARGLANSSNPRALSSINVSSPLYQEKLSFIAGKNDSLLASLSLKGGNMDFDMEIPSSILYKIKDLSLIVSNQTFFQDVWTNPLWRYPNGLNILFTINSQNPTVVENAIHDIMTIINNQYNVSSIVYSINSFNEGETKVSIFSFIDFFLQKEIFTDIFGINETVSNGNFVSLFHSQLLKRPSVYAFGFYLFLRNGKIQYLTRKAFVFIKEKIPVVNNERLLELSSILGTSLMPNTNALYSNIDIRFPFLANFTLVRPFPTNVAPKLSGLFQWVLKTPLFVIFPTFNASLHYYLSVEDSAKFPRVIITNSYSDTLIEENGIFKMNYEVENIGNTIAYNTTLFFPIPRELEFYSKENLSVPVLKDEIEINSSFSNEIKLKIDISSLKETDLLLRILGWYQNVSTNALERWNDTTQIPLYGTELTLISEHGFPSDLVDFLLNNVVPVLMNYTIEELYTNIDAVIEKLYESLIYTYNTTFYAFYDMKSIFNYISDDFQIIYTSFGSFLYCIIPEIGVNETIRVNWSIENIPTKYDRVGIFNLTSEANDDQVIKKYAIFQTKNTDYHTLLISKYSEIDSTGRILSDYDEITNSFINIGTRFKYSNINGDEYYGLTNGINIQIGDDEAIIESKLTTSSSVYSVGDNIFLTLNITNRGQIPAYDINIEIANIKLDFLWQPSDIIKLKSLTIDSIAPNESFVRIIQLRANSYIGFNTYIAFISFVSDKDQSGVEVTDPWTNQTSVWTYGGETKNIVTSTLVSGLLIPSQSFVNKSRPSFPLPEVVSNVSYSLSSDNSTVTVQYEISNTGLSEANVSITQFLDNSTYSSLESVEIRKSGASYNYVVSSYLTYIKLNLIEQVTLLPGEKVTITETYSIKNTKLVLSPLQIEYYSLYEIMTTDFQSDYTDLGEESTVFVSEYLHFSPLNATESDQAKFKWSSYSDSIDIDLPPIEEEPTTNFVVTFPEIHFMFIVVSVGTATVVVSIFSIISAILRKRKGYM